MRVLCKYKTIVKNSDNWYEIDDNIIKEIEIDDVINQNAFVLIYEKSDNDMNDDSNEEKQDKNDDINKNDIINDNSGNKDLKNKNKKGKNFREEEELLNNEEMFGIKTFGQIEDI